VNTARRADPNRSNRAGHSMPRAVMLGSVWGSWAAGSHLRLGTAHVAADSGSSSVHSAVCVFSLSVSLLLLFALFVVLLNCTYPNPPVFAFFFLFSSPPQREGGVAVRLCGPFVASHGQAITTVKKTLFLNPYSLQNY